MGSALPGMKFSNSMVTCITGTPSRYEHCFDKPVWKTSTKTFRDMYAKHEERYIMLISMGYRVTTCGNLIGGN